MFNGDSITIGSTVTVSGIRTVDRPGRQRWHGPAWGASTTSTTPQSQVHPQRRSRRQNSTDELGRFDTSDIGPSDYQLFALRGTGHATVDNARLYIETSAGTGWVDVAELRFAKIS